MGSFVVQGNRAGCAGIGYGKHSKMDVAVQRALRDCARNTVTVDLKENRTVWHQLDAKWVSTKIRILPRPAGFGLTGSPLVVTLCEAFGLKDLSVKVHGSRNPMNVAKAFFKALDSHQTPEEVARRRGKSVASILGSA